MREILSGTQAADAMLDVGPVATAAAFAKLGNNKAVGPDDIPAELFKAGLDSLACKFAEVNLRTARGSRRMAYTCGRCDALLAIRVSRTKFLSTTRKCDVSCVLRLSTALLPSSDCDT